MLSISFEVRAASRIGPVRVAYRLGSDTGVAVRIYDVDTGPAPPVVQAPGVIRADGAAARRVDLARVPARPG